MASVLHIENDHVQLLTQLSNGDRQAFQTIYNSYSKPILSSILRLVKDPEIAKELLQDVFLKIWEKRELIDPQKSFKSFLYMIAKNLVYDHFRKVSNSKLMQQEMMKMITVLSNPTEDQIYLKEFDFFMAKAIDTLPPQTKRIYCMSRVEGMTHKQISEQLNITLSTVNNHLVKSSKVIKDYIGRNQDFVIISAILAFVNKFY